MARNFFFACSGLFFLVAALVLAGFALDSGHRIVGVRAVAGGEGVVVVMQNGETYLMRFGQPYVNAGNLHGSDVRGITR